MAADVKPEDLKDDALKLNELDNKDEDLHEADTQGISKDCAQTEGTQSVPSSQNSMDCCPAGGLEESKNASDKSNLAETQFFQKFKRSSSPGPQPAKNTCVAADSSKPKLILCLNNSPRKDVCTPSDVEMLSPSSPISKSTLINCSEKDLDCANCEQDSSFEMSQEMHSHFVRDNDSGCSAKDEVQQVASETKDAVKAECSGACGLIENPSGAVR